MDSLKKIKIQILRILSSIKNFYNEKIETQIPANYLEHLENISIIIFSYLVSSLVIKTEFNLLITLKELFAIICCYLAIIFWFIDKVSKENRYRFAMAVVTFIAPILFITNHFSVAITILLIIICLNFVFFECLRVKNLFSSKTPAYVICEEEYDPNILKFLRNHYKVVEIIELNKNEENHKKHSLKDLEEMKAWLRKINKFLFYIFPRTFIYLARQNNPETILSLLEIAGEFSIPLKKATGNQILPITSSDIDSFKPTSQEKSMISSIVKNKKVWISYDGREFILELIKCISLVNSADITVICENEKLLTQIDENINQQNRNFKTRVACPNMICALDTAPDVIFYSLPLTSANINETHFKDAAIKNIIETDNVIKFTQKRRAKYVFLISSNSHSHAWLQATSLIAENLAQLADSEHRKRYTKFIPIRIPNYFTDQFQIFEQMKAFINGCQDNISSASEIFLKKDVMPLLIKCIYMSIKDNSFNSNANTYIINPKSTPTTNILQFLKNLLGINEVKLQISEKEKIQPESCSPIIEDINETSIEGISFSKLKNLEGKSYKETPSIEQINSMGIRELTADIFDRISQAQKTPEDLKEELKNEETEEESIDEEIK